MSLLVKFALAVATLSAIAMVGFSTWTLAATTAWETMRLAMWACLCAVITILAALITYLLHRGGCQEEECVAFRDVTTQKLQDQGATIAELQQRLAMHIALEGYHEAIGQPMSCAVLPFDKKLRGLPTPREDQDQQEASERN